MLKFTRVRYSATARRVVFVGGEGNGRQRGKIILAHEHEHLRRLQAAAQFHSDGENAAAGLFLKGGVDPETAKSSRSMSAMG